MNPDPKFAPMHMRARIAGYDFAECRNCKFLLSAKKGNRWCDLHSFDPQPAHALSRTICMDYKPRER